MVGFFYLAAPFLALWIIFRILFGHIKARTFMFFVFMFSVVWFFSTSAGLFASFWFEPESYWHTMHLDLSYWDTHAFPPGDTLAHVLVLPYIAAVQGLLIWLYIMHTHFNWSFAVFYGVGIWTMINILSCIVSCKRMRNPNYGF